MEDIVEADICDKEWEDANDWLQDRIDLEELDFKRVALEGKDDLEDLTVN